MPEPYAPALRLQGSWRWVSSLDVHTQQLHTPAEAGFSATLRFSADSARSGTFVYTRTNRDPTTGRFLIGSEDAPGNDFVAIERSIDFLARNAWIAIGRDSLYLGGVMESGFNSRYVRIAE